MLDDEPQSPASIRGGAVPAVMPTKNPNLSPLYTYASPEHRRQLLLTARQRSGVLAPTAPQEVGSAALGGGLPPIQPTQRQARRGSGGSASPSRGSSRSSQHSVGSLGSVPLGSAGLVARQLGIFGSGGRNAKVMGLPLSIDDDINDSPGDAGGLIPAIHASSTATSAAGGGLVSARGIPQSPVGTLLQSSAGRSASGTLMGNWSAAPTPNALEAVPLPAASTPAGASRMAPANPLGSLLAVSGGRTASGALQGNWSGAGAPATDTAVPVGTAPEAVGTAPEADGAAAVAQDALTAVTEEHSDEVSAAATSAPNAASVSSSRQQRSP